MHGFFRRLSRSSELERELRGQRPQPRPELYRALVRQASATRTIRRPALTIRRPALRGAFVAGIAALTILSFAAVAGGVRGLMNLGNNNNVTPAQRQYEKCNSGRGNLSETESGIRQTNSATLVNPHEGGRGPGPFPTDDCDPGNSGNVNRGGD